MLAAIALRRQYCICGCQGTANFCSCLTIRHLWPQAYVWFQGSQVGKKSVHADTSLWIQQLKPTSHRTSATPEVEHHWKNSTLHNQHKNWTGPDAVIVWQWLHTQSYTEFRDICLMFAWYLRLREEGASELALAATGLDRPVKLTSDVVVAWTRNSLWKGETEMQSKPSAVNRRTWVRGGTNCRWTVWNRTMKYKEKAIFLLYPAMKSSTLKTETRSEAKPCARLLFTQSCNSFVMCHLNSTAPSQWLQSLYPATVTALTSCLTPTVTDKKTHFYTETLPVSLVDPEFDMIYTCSKSAWGLLFAVRAGTWGWTSMDCRTVCLPPAWGQN